MFNALGGNSQSYVIQTKPSSNVNSIHEGSVKENTSFNAVSGHREVWILQSKYTHACTESQKKSIRVCNCHRVFIARAVRMTHHDHIMTDASLCYCFLFQCLHHDGKLCAELLLLHRRTDCRYPQTYPSRWHRDRSCEIILVRSLQVRTLLRNPYW